MIPVSGSTPKRSAICAILSGLNVPSVSDRTFSAHSRYTSGQLTDVGDFTVSATEILGKLRDDGHGVRQLGLSASKLAKDLTDAHGLEATEQVSTRLVGSTEPDSPAEDSIKLLAPGRDFQDAFALLAELVGSLEASSGWLNPNQPVSLYAAGAGSAYLTLYNSILDLFNLDLAEPLDLEQCATSGSMDRLRLLLGSLDCKARLEPSHSNCVVAVGLELRNVNRANSVSLDGIDIHDEAFLSNVSTP
jgi:hypothetical protein